LAVDLFALRMNMEVTGAAQAAGALRSVDAQGKQTAVSAAQAEAALRRMGLSGDALATSLNRMGFQSTAAAAAGVQLGGAMNAMTAGMASASGRVIHPMAQAMSGASTAALANAVAIRQTEIRMREAARAGEAFKVVKQDIANVLGSGLFRFFAIAGAIDMTRRAYNAVTEASDRQVRSTLMLDGVSRIAGLSLGMMQQVAGRLRTEFRTSTADANELTASAARLTSKAGESAKTFEFLSSWLNVAAAQGIGTSEALLALNITLRGQDEGLDRLFQKNPSVIWKEYAQSLGLTVGQLTEAQKWQAIMNATLDAASKVGDAYGRFLDTAPGKQGALNAKMEDFAAALGRVFNPLRMLMADVATPFLNWLGNVIERMQNLNVGSLGGLAANLGRAMAGAGDPGKPDPGGAVARDENPALAALGPLPTTPPKPAPTAAEIKAAKEKAEEERRQRLLNEVLNASPVATLTGVTGTPITTRNDRIGVSLPGGTFGQGTTRTEQAVADWENRVKQQAARVQREFSQLGQNLGMTLANGFASAMSAAMQGKNPFAAFGKAVLAGLGSIFVQMGAELIAYGIIMLNLLPFLSNPFTSGPAAIAAGAALVAIGTVLGSIATGSGSKGGGAGGGGPVDKTTHITLTADGLGGRTAPNRPDERFTVLGVNSPRGQRVLGEAMKGAARRNIK
jgi:hypothetical protein